MCSGEDTPCRVGCPIRMSTDQRLLAAPHGFSQRATSFIASWCQGIHRMPFSRSITPPCTRTTHQQRSAVSTQLPDDRQRSLVPHTMKQQAQPSALSIRHTRNERATFKRAVTSHTSLIASIAIRTTTPPTHAPPLTEQHTGTQGRSDKPARTATTRDVTRT